MSRDTITSALDAGGQVTRIEDASPGRFYSGATPHHAECELYPVFRRRGKSSFSHRPRRGSCGGGESDVHRETCANWLRFCQTQLSDCAMCAFDGLSVREHSICPVEVWRDGRWTPAPTRRFYGLIVWTCEDCMKPHVWDLLDGAARVLSNRTIPLMGSRVRPDLTVLDSSDRPLALVEFRKSHLSSAVRELADRKGIPLFVVDITESSDRFQLGLNNRRRFALRYLRPELSPDEEAIEEAMERSMDMLSYDVGRTGGVSSEFSRVQDDHGNLIDIGFRADGKTEALPEPSVGGFLVAHRSNLSCESQRRWIAEDWEVSRLTLTGNESTIGSILGR